jgi:hypothetical protein
MSSDLLPVEPQATTADATVDQEGIDPSLNESFLAAGADHDFKVEEYNVLSGSAEPSGSCACRTVQPTKTRFKVGLPHPESLAMRNAKYLSTLGAEVHVAAPQIALEFPEPQLIEWLRAMWAEWRYVVFFFELSHSIISGPWPGELAHQQDSLAIIQVQDAPPETGALFQGCRTPLRVSEWSQTV